jgi:NAD(P)H-hydrate repair Nnr-like enzyme with NAD(P)H-hydrate epimerase domain
MKSLLKSKLPAAPECEETITDALLGTGEHMCTCAALVADIIIEQGQENSSVKELLARMGQGNNGGDSAAEKKA